MAKRKIILGLALVLVTGPALAPAQDNVPLDLNQLIDAANEWAKENLDEETLRALPELDRAKVDEFLKQAQAQLQGERVFDLAPLRTAAQLALPLLDAHEESKPYAAWLRARLDYFEVAEDLRQHAPPPKIVPGQPEQLAPNPTSATERKTWQKKLSQREWPDRAGELVPKLKPLFRAANVPPQLVWVAEVESSFNPQARSPAGAAGLFQLMPATAKNLGLRRWPLDQRYQPEPSATAAATYLKQLHNKFGDWRLALAAYNAGAGRVSGLLEKRKARTFDQIADALPAETQLYVPKVEATILRREGIALSKLKAI